MMPPPYTNPYTFIPDDGPSKGNVVMLPRHYDAFESAGGLYIWDAKAESYRWHEGVTLEKFLKERHEPR